MITITNITIITVGLTMAAMCVFLRRKSIEDEARILKLESEIVKLNTRLANEREGNESILRVRNKATDELQAQIDALELKLNGRQEYIDMFKKDIQSVLRIAERYAIVDYKGQFCYHCDEEIKENPIVENRAPVLYCSQKCQDMNIPF